MRFLVASAIFFILSLFCFAKIVLGVNYPALTWVDTDKHAIKINTDGSITLNFVVSPSTPAVLIGYPSVTLIDSRNSVRININSDGSLKLVTK